MTRIALTGASGFIGKNVRFRLDELKIPVVVIGHDLRGTTLEQALTGADVVVHLAGVNRPKEEEEFAAGNAGMTQAMAGALRSLGKAAPVIYASSTQAGNDTPYGLSKRAAEDILVDYGRRSGAPIHALRLPNVFGKWSRPNYNSVVATFCHNIARDLPIAISDPSAPLELIYVDDVVEIIVALIAQPARRSDDMLRPTYSTTVGALAEQIKAFRDSRRSLLVGPVGTGLARALHATYLSFLDATHFAYDLPKHTDPRGTFVEMLRTPQSGQVSFFTANPGITRGGHYHHSKTEKFLVVSGQALFRFRNIVTGEYAEIQVRAEDTKVVETVPGWSHDVTNTGGDTLICMLWANELFDPERPDTFSAKVP
ncbi:UDP-2-acetamido-2,6-beta-L-arabino-hexul-4-ose reductase [Devosia ginsengisoli]|uniref:SDR family oxidoreductase n=1 Tax=Devosia ginsengisoli TaxID=400770 RepID=A0A5B8LTP9_9HYPH|nr:NAD-dependent epimerase/dehydratase family protein [Devosia ginsengisoli]QDZ11638.1 SDR family oxidoreductase [Devosia ginsengisoli]